MESLTNIDRYRKFNKHLQISEVQMDRDQPYT